jgi:hypothetical protein
MVFDPLCLSFKNKKKNNQERKIKIKGKKMDFSGEFGTSPPLDLTARCLWQPTWTPMRSSLTNTTIKHVWSATITHRCPYG